MTRQQTHADLVRRGFDASFPMGRDNAGRFNASVLVACSQCEALVINGVATHETGCPNQTHECSGCWSRVPLRMKYCEDCR